MRVALVGRDESRLRGAPVGDPSWSFWGCPWDPRMRHHFDVLFDPHQPLHEEGHEWAKGTNLPFYTVIPASGTNNIIYPMDDIKDDVFKDVGHAYLESTIAYMMALAIHQGAYEIGLYGISMSHQTEHGYQRPNMEFLIGLAIGRGIKITQDNTQKRPGLLTSNWPWGVYGRR